MDPAHFVISRSRACEEAIGPASVDQHQQIVIPACEDLPELRDGALGRAYLLLVNRLDDTPGRRPRCAKMPSSLVSRTRMPLTSGEIPSNWRRASVSAPISRRCRDLRAAVLSLGGCEITVAVSGISPITGCSASGAPPPHFHLGLSPGRVRGHGGPGGRASWPHCDHRPKDPWPGTNPPRAAGPSGVTSTTSPPSGFASPRPLAISGVSSWMRTPSQPRATLPPLISLLDHRPGQRVAGTAKAMPTDPPFGE